MKAIAIIIGCFLALFGLVAIGTPSWVFAAAFAGFFIWVLWCIASFGQAFHTPPPRCHHRPDLDSDDL